MSEAVWIAIVGIVGTGAVGLGTALLQHCYNLKGRKDDRAHEKERTLEQLQHQNLERHIAEVEPFADNVTDYASVLQNYGSVKDNHELAAKKLLKQGNQLLQAGIIAGTRAQIAAIVLESDVLKRSISDLIKLTDETAQALIIKGEIDKNYEKIDWGDQQRPINQKTRRP